MGTSRKTEINQFKDAGSAINRGIKFISTQLSCSLTIEYMEDYMDRPVVISRKAHRTVWTTSSMDIYNLSCQQRSPPSYSIRCVIFRHWSKQQYLWLMGSIKEECSKEKVLIIYKFRNKWANFKQYILDEDSHMASLIPLRGFLNKFHWIL